MLTKTGSFPKWCRIRSACPASCIAMLLFSFSVRVSTRWRKRDFDAGLARWWLQLRSSSISSFLRTERGVIFLMDPKMPSFVRLRDESSSIRVSVVLASLPSCMALKVVTMASFMPCSISAPVKPCVFWASSFKLKAPGSCDLLSRCMRNISSLSSALGRSTKNTSS